MALSRSLSDRFAELKRDVKCWFGVQPWFLKLLYFAGSLRHSNFGDFRNRAAAAAKEKGPGQGVALCVRIRDEAPNLTEFVEYYLAAGVSHFFFYEKLSLDNFRDTLAPYVERGVATLLEDWPHLPISPAAEEDCVLRSIGRFKWLGFIDADEFVVVRDGRSIDEFLSNYLAYPAVALHWLMFGSNGHETRPGGPAIASYTRREEEISLHVKIFVQPGQAANYLNCHSWYYQGMRRAVNEKGRPVYAARSMPATAELAWINHYYHKSDEEYFQKGARKSVQDKGAIKYNSRTMAMHLACEKSNAVEDLSALNYYASRCRTLSQEPVLLAASAS